MISAESTMMAPLLHVLGTRVLLFTNTIPLLRAGLLIQSRQAFHDFIDLAVLLGSVIDLRMCGGDG